MAGPIVSVLKYWFAVIKTTVTLWLEAQVFVHAAALAFFTVFSVAPVVIVAVTLVGLVLGESAAQGRIAEHLQVTIGPEAAAAIQTAVENSRIQHSGLLPTMAGFAAILFGATTVFTQMQDALNAIWGVAPLRISAACSPLMPCASAVALQCTRQLPAPSSSTRTVAR